MEADGGEPHHGGGPDDVRGEVSALACNARHADEAAEKDREEENEQASPTGEEGDKGEEEIAHGGVTAGKRFSGGFGLVMEEAFELFGAIEGGGLGRTGSSPLVFEDGVRNKS